MRRRKGVCLWVGFRYLSGHIQVGPQTGHHVIPGSNHIGRQTTDTVVAIADVVHVSVGDTRAVAANTAGITASVTILEPGWRCKVQTRVGARFPQSVTRRDISKEKKGERYSKYHRAQEVPMRGRRGKLTGWASRKDHQMRKPRVYEHEW